MTTNPLVLVLCTSNSCHSHLAEGILRQASGGLIEVSSAELKYKFRRKVFE
jgi:arsenate reductase